MCGIIGIVGNGRDVSPHLLDALKRLEYRGYDSAGVATVHGGRLDRRRAEGKLANLDALLQAEPLAGNIGIGHTRWATHGAPTVGNAHPHATDTVAVVHNGIIENYQALREELAGDGATFDTETDTEVVAVLLSHLLAAGKAPEAAIAETANRLEGAFSIAALLTDHPDMILGARRGSPLAVGYGDGEMYLGSDAMALAPFTNRVSYLDDGDWAVLRREGAVIHDAAGAVADRPVVTTSASGALIGKGNYRHFMQKEIHEQPEVIGYTLHNYFDPARHEVHLPELPFDLAELPKVTIVACGTSYHAALVAKYWMEQVARVPVEIDFASEFRYRGAAMPAGGLALFVSQSGETADTLAALRYARTQDQHIAVIANVPESSMAREADVVLQTLAGPEIGVASTKAFTTQLVVLACLSVALATARGAIDDARRRDILRGLAEIPSRVNELLGRDAELLEIAHMLQEARDVLYLGRGTGFAVALEGALKLKELSYIHAEGYAAGEMKHGPIALIDEAVPIIVVAPFDPLFDKTAANTQEVIARGGRVILLSDEEGCARFDGQAAALIELPRVDPFVAPILYSVPVQMLAYHTAVLKGTDVDQPRNLAKSVTVE